MITFWILAGTMERREIHVSKGTVLRNYQLDLQ